MGYQMLTDNKVGLYLPCFLLKWYNVNMTPISIEVKDYIRQFFKNRMQAEKNNTANMAMGFTIRENEIEKFVDNLWVFINSKKLAEDQNEKG